MNFGGLASRVLLFQTTITYCKWILIINVAAKSLNKTIFDDETFNFYYFGGFELEKFKPRKWNMEGALLAGS